MPFRSPCSALSFLMIVFVAYVAMPTSTAAARTRKTRVETLVREGRYLEAREVLRARVSVATKRTLNKAQTDLARLERRLPRLVIRAPRNVGGSILLDGRELENDLAWSRADDDRLDETAIEVDPGEHEVALVDNEVVLVEHVTVEERERHLVILDRAPRENAKPRTTPRAPAAADVKPPPAVQPPVALARNEPAPRTPSTLRTIGFVGLASSAVLLGGGALFAGLATDQRSSLAARCPDDRCATTSRPTYEVGRSYADVATLAFISGGALAATSIALIAFAPRNAERRIEVAASPTAITLRGRFQ